MLLFRRFVRNLNHIQFICKTQIQLFSNESDCASLYKSKVSKRDGKVKGRLDFPIEGEFQDSERELLSLFYEKKYVQAFSMFRDLFVSNNHKFSPSVFALVIQASLLGTTLPVPLLRLIYYVEKEDLELSAATCAILLNMALNLHESKLVHRLANLYSKRNIPFRKNIFADVFWHILGIEKDYANAKLLLDQYLKMGQPLSDDVIGHIYCEMLENKNDILYELTEKILDHYSQPLFSIEKMTNWRKLADILRMSGRYADTTFTYISENLCQNCNSELQKISVSPEEYSTLERELKQVIDNEYLKYSRTRHTESEINRFHSYLNDFTEQVSESSDKIGLIIDGMNAGFSGLKRSLDVKHLLRFIENLRIFCSTKNSLIVIRRHAMKDFPADFDKQVNKSYIFPTNVNSRDDIFALYAGVKLRENGLVATCDKLGEFRCELPMQFEELFQRWSQKHIIKFTRGYHVNFYQGNQMLWKIQKENGRLHIPLKQSNDWICAKILSNS